MVKQTTKSYTYLAAGQVDGVYLMKVGKTNHLKRRSRQLGLPIALSISSLTEKGAFHVESALRQFVIQQGGVRFKNTIDWFILDQRIYDLLQEYFVGLSAHEPAQTLSLDEEIATYRRRYIELLVNEYRRERDTALAQLQDAVFEIDRLRKELKEQRDDSGKEIIELNRQIARLELRLEMITEELKRAKKDE
jgi:hypothetical protein